MKVLKWIASVLAAVIGLSLLIAGGLFIASFSAFIGSAILGLMIVSFVATGLKKYFTPKKKKVNILDL